MKYNLSFEDYKRESIPTVESVDDFVGLGRFVFGIEFVTFLRIPICRELYEFDTNLFAFVTNVALHEFRGRVDPHPVDAFPLLQRKMIWRLQNPTHSIRLRTISSKKKTFSFHL